MTRAGYPVERGKEKQNDRVHETAINTLALRGLSLSCFCTIIKKRSTLMIIKIATPSITNIQKNMADIRQKESPNIHCVVTMVTKAKGMLRTANIISAKARLAIREPNELLTFEEEFSMARDPTGWVSARDGNRSLALQLPPMEISGTQTERKWLITANVWRGMRVALHGGAFDYKMSKTSASASGDPTLSFEVYHFVAIPNGSYNVKTDLPPESFNGKDTIGHPEWLNSGTSGECTGSISSEFARLILRFSCGKVVLQESLQVLKSGPLFCVFLPALDHQLVKGAWTILRTGHPVIRDQNVGRAQVSVDVVHALNVGHTAGHLKEHTLTVNSSESRAEKPPTTATSRRTADTACHLSSTECYKSTSPRGTCRITFIRPSNISFI
ncbi:hypothetical protein DNTS_007258 [Danionella cerebrum]|uniref:Uncharacterized protein n=1 Tax=Danionella cerebrum TaxID=2873325 RepID=A0A553NRJ1_9TELE|nr:hypothetical protein DNTS_007258 [Danionella translucida]